MKSLLPSKYESKNIVPQKNFQLILPTQGITGPPENIPKVENNAHHPRNFMIPLQLQRIRQDVATATLAIEESENAYYPHRFRLQQLYVSFDREGQIFACMEKRKRLTLQKEFCIGKKNDEGVWVKNEKATLLFENKKWFKHLVTYILEKKFYGYSLIQLGDLEVKNGNYEFKNLTTIKRWHVSPDRLQLVQIPYQTWGLHIASDQFKAHDEKNGIHFSEDVDENGVPYNDWMVYVDTPSTIGSSICGWGLLWNVCIYAIILKNNLAHNADYTQMFSAPYRHIKTPEKRGSDEYNALERSAADMGGFGYLLTSDQEIVEFIQGNTGTGFQSYADLEKRCQSMISKIILGHSDALDPTPGKLGATQSGTQDEDLSPVGRALAEIEKDDNDDCLNDLNDICLPKFRNLGFPISEDECFYIMNGKEEFENRKKEDSANTVTATIAQTMKNAGLKMDAKYFEARTGIPTEDAPEPEPAFPSFGKNINRIQNKLKRIYHA